MAAVIRLFKEFLSASLMKSEMDLSSWTQESIEQIQWLAEASSAISLNLLAVSEGATPFISGTREQ